MEKLNCRLGLGEDMIDLPPTKNMLQLYSTGELKKNGSANLYYTRQRAGKDMGRLPCALLGQCTEPFFFYNAVSVKTLILGHFSMLKKNSAGNIWGGRGPGGEGGIVNKRQRTQ